MNVITITPYYKQYNTQTKQTKIKSQDQSQPSFQGRYLNRRNCIILALSGTLAKYAGDLIDTPMLIDNILNGASHIGFLGAMYVKEKPRILAKHIDFTPASTISQAKEFAKENLKIPNFKIDDLDFANMINEGLTNINNKFEGKIFIPTTIKFTKRNTSYTGCYRVFLDVLSFNKYEYEDSAQALDDIILSNKSARLNIEDLENLKRYNLGNGYNEFCEKIDIAKSDLNSLNTIEKWALMRSIIQVKQASDLIDRLGEPIHKMMTHIKGLNFMGPVYANKFSTLYHEMGHVFDRKLLPGYRCLFSKRINNADELLLPAYTKSSKAEFVADIFSGYMKGDRYLDNIEEMFDEFTKIRFPHNENNIKPNIII